MKRNFLLFVVVLTGIILAVNSTKRLMSFRTTAKQVAQAQKRLEALKKENEAFKKESEYKKSKEFAESEIRNKLGLAKEGETVVIIPKDEKSQQEEVKKDHVPNWQKWWNLFFGS